MSANQCFLIVMLIAAVRGFARGWHREIITCALMLGSVLFLTIGGGDALAQLVASFLSLFRGIFPQLTYGTPSTLAIDFLILVAFTVLADIAGTRFGATPKAVQHRLAGMAAGAVTGLALVYYITRQLLPSTTFNLTSPTTAIATSWIIGLFGVGMMVLLVLALVRR
jgi:uncharacterized membrane protein YozB (DUF420 family)